MSRFVEKLEGTTCDSCGESVRGTKVPGWGELVVWRDGAQLRLDLCPKCAAKVIEFIDDKCERIYTGNEKRG